MAINIIKPLGMAGVNKDLPPSELPANIWSDSLNMRFRNAQAEKRKGITEALTAPAIIPYALSVYTATSFRYVLYAGTAEVHVDDGDTQTEITRASGDYTGAASDLWSIPFLNGVLVMSNGVDDPQYWDGNPSNDLLPLPGWTTGDKAKVMVAFKDFLFALGPTLSSVYYPHLIKWSGAAEAGSIPNEWTASATNLAGDSPQASDTGGEIVGGKVLGDTLIVYKRDGRYAVNYIGGNDVFSVRRLSGSDGLLSMNCVADTPKGHVFVSNDDIKIHSGGEAVSIAEGRIKTWFFDNLDVERAHEAFAVPNLATSEVWIALPTLGSTACEFAAVWNWQHDTWQVFSLPQVICAATGLLPDSVSTVVWNDRLDDWETYTESWVDAEYSVNATRLIVANAAKVGVTESGTDDFGDPMEWSLEKTGIQFDDPVTVKVLRASRPQIIGAAGVQATVYHAATMGPNDSPSYGTGVTYTVGTSNWANKFSKGGRYLAIKLAGNRSEALTVRSADLDFAPQGRF